MNGQNQDPCGCCEGTEAIIPRSTANRPGLSAIAYRIGTHEAFLETMLARLSSIFLDISINEFDEQGKAKSNRIFPLMGLTTRSPDDFAIALLDSWATVAHVLAFYQERLANEGYLRTATERRSIQELARLVGYRLRPGVASTVYLAYTIDQNATAPVTIPAGAKSQSLPGPGELPQTFETAEDLEGRREWNELKPRMSRAQTRLSIRDILGLEGGMRVYLNGISTKLQKNDPLLIQFGSRTPELFRVLDVKTQPELGMTVVSVEDWMADDPFKSVIGEIKAYFSPIGEFGIIQGASGIDTKTITEISVILSALSDTNVFESLEQVSAHSDDDVAPNIKLWIDQLHFELEVALERYPDSARRGVDLVAALREIADLYDDIKSFGISSASRTVKKVRLVLGQINSLSNTTPASADIQNQLANNVLPALANLLNAAQANKEMKIASWIEQIAKQVEVISTKGENIPESAPAGKQGFEISSALSRLTIPGSVPSRNSVFMARNVSDLYAAKAEAGFRTLSTFQPQVKEQLRSVLANAAITDDPNIKVYALRTKASLFGHNSPGRLAYFIDAIEGPPIEVLPDDNTPNKRIEVVEWTPEKIRQFESGVPITVRAWGSQTIFLDSEYNKVILGDWVVMDATAVLGDGVSATSLIEFPQWTSGSSASTIAKGFDGVLITKVKSSSVLSRSAYGIGAKSTKLELDGKYYWLQMPEGLIGDPTLDYFDAIRRTVVYTQTEVLALSEEPIDDEVCDGVEDEVELDALYADLKSGRWAVVSGERTDIPGTSGVTSSELVMLAGVRHDVAFQYFGDIPVPLAGDKTHTFVTFDKPLSFCYKRDTVTINGNVVKATHGETRTEILGSGDAGKAFQSFTLKQSPLTYTASPTPEGAESTLHIRVNNVEWHEAGSLAGLGPTDHKFITRADDDGNTTSIFGTGKNGARIPTGVENVRAVYRSGIGKPGNAREEQISLLMTRPLGVKGVVNPARASGGADRDSRDLARKNTPLAVMALDRLVSVEDYALFTRTFAGIGKAVSAKFSYQNREIVHVTIAGADDIPIDETSDLYINLVQALRKFGDAHQPIRVDVRELMFILISANVRILPDYAWDDVADRIRATLLDYFSFESRDIGQDVFLSEVISAIQNIVGVEYVDVDLLRGIPEKLTDPVTGERRLLAPDEISAIAAGPLKDESGNVLRDPLNRIDVNFAGVKNNLLHPAQLAYLSPEVPDTLILNLITTKPGI